MNWYKVALNFESKPVDAWRIELLQQTLQEMAELAERSDESVVEQAAIKWNEENPDLIDLKGNKYPFMYGILSSNMGSLKIRIGTALKIVTGMMNSGEQIPEQPVSPEQTI